ncbi:MAG: hypothetical protein GF364_05635, partial [Candidatus Lokiarchaeota archaeon]|nr:hypothetical protein [Candidatus Lokiarchaeota archaeon]
KQLTLDSFKSSNKIVVVDIETSAKKPNLGYIVEIGICELDLSTENCTELFNSLVKEAGFNGSCKDAWIFQNSDLTFEEVMQAPSFNSLKPELQKIFSVYPATAYNKQFDFNWLRSRGLKIKEVPCPMKVATPILKLPPKYDWQTDYKWPNVEEAYSYFYNEIPYKELHRAYDDAVHEAQIVLALYKQGFWKTEVEINDFV